MYYETYYKNKDKDFELHPNFYTWFIVPVLIEVLVWVDYKNLAVFLISNRPHTPNLITGEIRPRILDGQNYFVTPEDSNLLLQDNKWFGIVLGIIVMIIVYGVVYDRFRLQWLNQMF